MGFLYIAQVPSGAVKIGSTRREPAVRVRGLRFNGERARLCAWKVEKPTGGYGEEYRIHNGPIGADRVFEKRGMVKYEWYWPSPRIAELARSWGGSIEMPVDAAFLGAGI